MNNTLLLVLILGSILFIASTCEKKSSDNKSNKLYIINLQEERDDRNWRMQYDYVNSPFYADTSIKFKPLNFYQPHLNLIFKSKLYLYENPEEIQIVSTLGETRQYLRYGYFLLKFANNEFKLNLYKMVFSEQDVYNLWFKDATNGTETYENGRYLFFNKNEDANFEYTIDFNRAINPMCAYSKLFNCPIPTSQDSIPFEIKAGEKKFW
jgi:uncharacterized protein (DUF1684 family)